MHTNLTEKIGPKNPNLVVALFADSQAAHGALADLRDAGFSNSQISLAFSAEDKQAQLGKTEAHYLSQHAVSGESVHPLLGSLDHSKLSQIPLDPSRIARYIRDG